MDEITLYLHYGDLPMDKNKVATTDKIKRWGYMAKIKAEPKTMTTRQSLNV